jgi:hypothetical protein
MTDETLSPIGPEPILATAAPAPDEPPAPLPAEAAEPPSPAAELHAMKLGFSRRSAERAHGQETLAKVHDWAQAKAAAEPAFNAAMFASDDPYEDAVQAWRRDQVLAAIGDADLAEVEAFRAWRTAKAAAGGEPASPPALGAPPPPRSLATAPGNATAGAAGVASGAGAAFRSAFT